MPAKDRFPWVAVSAAVAAIVIAAMVALPLPVESPRVTQPEKLPSLGLTRISRDNATELLMEQIVAYDPAPMFIPSAMNSSAPELPAGPGELGPFADIPSRFSRSAPLGFPAAVKIPSNPVEALKRSAQSEDLLALGLTDGFSGNTLTATASVEVVRLGEGAIVLALDMPNSNGTAAVDWQPLELIGAVRRTGLVGELVVSISSGSSEIDDNFRSLLRENVLIGDRLPVGFYTFRIGL